MTPARQGLDESGIRPSVSQRVAKLPDCSVESVFTVNGGVPGPEFLVELLAGDHQPRTSKQDNENSEWLFSKSDDR